MDLLTLNTPDTVRVNIVYPGKGVLKNDDGSVVAIDLYSPAAESVIAYREQVERESLNKTLKNEPITVDDLKRDKIARLMAFTADVHNLELSGEVITRNNIDRLYSDPNFGWLTEQIEKRLTGWNDFLAQ